MWLMMLYELLLIVVEGVENQQAPQKVAEGVQGGKVQRHYDPLGLE